MRVFDLLKTRIERMEEKKDIKGLILALKDEDKQVRQESARALGNLGSNEASKPLIETLQDPDAEVKEEAITALGKIGDPEATKPLLDTFNSPNIVIRWRVARALGKIGSRDAVKPLTNALKDPDLGVKEEAIIALGKIGDSEATKPLIAALNDRNISIRQSVVRSLGKISSPDAVKPLTNALQDPDAGVKEEAITALGRISIKPMLEDLESIEPSIKEEAIIKLDHLRDLSMSENDESTTKAEKSEDSEANAQETFQKKDIDQPKLKEVRDKKESKVVRSKKESKEVRSKKEFLNEPKTFKLDKESQNFTHRRNQLIESGYHIIIGKFLAEAKYDYQEDFVRKSCYDYQFLDIEKLKYLLEYKGFSFEDEEILRLIQEEIENQEYQEFTDKMLENHPTTPDQFLENYIQNYNDEIPQNIKNLQKLLQKKGIVLDNLENIINQKRKDIEIKEFEKRLFQGNTINGPKEKDSHSILTKFIEKEFIENRNALISSGNHRFIENFVRISQYHYKIGDLHKLYELLKKRGLKFKDGELLWLVQAEIENQEYQEFADKIMENHPTTPDQFLENYIQNYNDETPPNIKNLQKLLQKEGIVLENLEKKIKQTRQELDIQEFENQLLNEEESSHVIPVIESRVTQDKALKNAQILFNRGNLFYDLGKLDDALKYYDQALCSYPEYVDAWKNKGLIYFVTGLYQKSVACYNHILTLDPNYGEIWLDIGAIFYEVDKNKEAKICYQKALGLAENDKETLAAYTRKFLNRNKLYRDKFEEFLKLVSTSQILDESSSTDSPISQILERINKSS